MNQINALTPEGRLPSRAVLHTEELIDTVLNGYVASAPSVAEAVADVIQQRSLVQAADVKRIVAATDPMTPIEDGDLLLVVEPAPMRQAWNDFTEYPTGQMPADWSQPWLAEGTWTVESTADATGGKALRFSAGNNSRRALAWTGVSDLIGGDLDNVEIVLKWRHVSGTPVTYLVGRGQNPNPTATGYSAGTNTGAEIENLRVGRYLDGSWAVVKWAPVPNPSHNGWMITRLSIEGDRVRARMWNAADPEPITWQVDEVNDLVSGAGWVGIVEPYSGVAEYDWIGVGTGGAPAPTRAVLS